mmetsp:Transcript_52811/g.60474  ORF Transcript_52811/g.60474 Transcript_52811/m.60474 type:complete len:242 (+) Transcript_52811:481-1206(+)|eukprot:CAMPEP_0114983668 /NCGR_PEP_ID=MMETSP0216-20121206/6830_1 /TAXON_ID=223996 /ORGANISM="Protocruzia adherens, Strain Boccale" /LENGTH=241 /DNA_ID=CAMNT_0002345681 /DNA_START=370 /DNA_END=1095 /DNA_ORIENTATION=+
MGAQDYKTVGSQSQTKCAIVDDYEIIKPAVTSSPVSEHVRRHRGNRKSRVQKTEGKKSKTSSNNSSRDSSVKSSSSKKSVTDSPKSAEAKKDYKLKYKTEICKNWEVYGSCKFGSSCAFAHGQHEIRRKIHLHDNYRTKQCKSFFQTGFCIYGSRCQFLHDKRNFKDVNLKENLDSEKFCYSEFFSGVVNNIHQKMRENGKSSVELSVSDPLLKYCANTCERPRLSIFETITIASDVSIVS